MVIKLFIAILICWFQWTTPAFGLDVAKLNRMTEVDRSAWVAHFVEVDLLKKDSALAFAETDLLLELAGRWSMPNIAVDVYAGQGNYLLNVLHRPKDARKKYAQGIDFANSHDLKVLAAGMLLQIGSSYCQEDKPVLAYEYYFRAHDIFVQAGFEHVDRIDRYEYDIGRFLYDLEDYKTAISHFSIAEQFAKSGPQINYKVLMATGWCYDRLGRQGEAMEYLQKRLQLAQREKNAGWIGESSVDVGERHLQDGCYPEARLYLTTGQRLSVEAGQFDTAARGLILLAEVNIQEGNPYAAAEKLTLAEQYLHQTGSENWYPDLYRAWVRIYEQSGDFREAYRHQQLYEHASDSIRQAAELRTYANIQVRLEGRRHIMQMDQSAQAEQTDRMLMLLAMFLGAILGVSAYFSWKYHQRRQKALILDKQRTEQALQQALQQVIYQQQQQVINQQQSLALEEAKPAPPVPITPPPAESIAPELFELAPVLMPDPKAQQAAKEAQEKILQLTLLTEEDSRNFRQLFEKIYPGFFTQLRTKFPELTQSETRLLALTKLNLKTKEMSEILKVETNSIRRLRNRIRQKYNLPAGDNFENLLSAND